MEYQNIEHLGDNPSDLKFAGYPVEVLYKDGDYFMKCKGVYISYTSFCLWEEDVSNNRIGVNKEGTEAQIRQRDGFTRIACLRETNESLNKLKCLIKSIIKCHQRQLELPLRERRRA